MKTTEQRFASSIQRIEQKKNQHGGQQNRRANAQEDKAKMFEQLTSDPTKFEGTNEAANAQASTEKAEPKPFIKPDKGMVIKSVLKPKKTVKAADGQGEWEVVEKRQSYLIQKPEDSDDNGSELSFD